MTGKLQPALLGGLLIGVLSVLPFVSKLNGCCCLWVLVGGVLTSYLLQERLPRSITAGEAAVAGLLAGVIGALFASIVGAVMASVMGGVTASFDDIPRDNMPPEFGRVLERMRAIPPALWYVVFAAVYLVIFPIFSMLGALLGVALFKKTPPPPPPGTIEILPAE
jgi:hypothetical protein